MQTADVQIGEPHSISAGLDYPGIGPQHAHLYDTKRVEFVNITDREAMEAGLQLSKLEGIIPAIESSHALAWLEKMTFSGDETLVIRSEERRVGKEWVSTGRSRWSLYH